MGITKSRRDQLREIENAIRMAQHGMILGPAGGKAILGGLAVLGAMEVAAYAGVAVPGFWPLLAIALVTSAVILARSPYKSYTALIYDLLLKYEPCDIAAYETLQAEVAEFGLRKDDMTVWLAAEWKAISGPNKISDTRQLFLDKRVDLHLVSENPKE